MQCYEIKSDSLKTRFNMVGGILIKSKLLCNFTVKTDTVGSVIKSFEKRQNFCLKAMDHFSQSFVS